MARWQVALGALILPTLGLLLAQQAGPPYVIASEARGASVLARKAIERIPPEALPFTRFIWIPWGDEGSDEIKAKAQATAFGLAQVNQGSTFTRPKAPHGGRLLQVDLRYMCPNANIGRYVELWEAFQFDPSFSDIITPDQVRLLDQVSKDLLSTMNGQECTVICWEKEQRVRKRMKLAEAVKMRQADTLIRVNGHHLDAQAHIELQAATKSLAPIIDARYFIYRATSTVQDDGLYKDVYGGLYYDLSGIREMCKGKEKTDLDNLLASLGIAGGINKLLEGGKADERAAIFRSNVTGRARLIIWFSAPSSRRTVNTGLVMLTRDIKRKRVDIGTHPIMNLVRFEHDATELIFEKPDGTHGFVLFDGKDKLQDAAPIDVVADRTVPAPHSPELSGAISCLRCHGTNKEAMGWQPFKNDVKTLLKHVGVFGDLGERNKPAAEVLDNLKGQYEGNPERPLQLGRDDYMAAVLRITGPWKGAEDQTDVVVRASEGLAEIYNEAWYDPVTPKSAMRDVGFIVDEKRAPGYLQKLLPPITKVGGIYPEDPRLVALCAGLSLSRFDYNLVFPFMSHRVQQTLAAFKGN